MTVAHSLATHSVPALSPSLPFSLHASLDCHKRYCPPIVSSLYHTRYQWQFARLLLRAISFCRSGLCRSMPILCGHSTECMCSNVPCTRRLVLQWLALVAHVCQLDQYLVLIVEYKNTDCRDSMANTGPVVVNMFASQWGHVRAVFASEVAIAILHQSYLPNYYCPLSMWSPLHLPCTDTR